MGLTSLLLLLISNVFSKGLNSFLTKYPTEVLRYISQDGRVVYTQKSQGVLSVINGYNSMDFINENSKNDFLVHASSEKIQILIESIPNPNDEYNLLKKHIIYASKYGSNSFKKIGEGRNSKLHILDEWASYFDPYSKKIHIVNLYTEKQIEILLSKKNNPYFFPEVHMVNSSNILYTDVDEIGYAHLVSYNQSSKVRSILYKASQVGTKLEICGTDDYVAFGEFPYEGITRSSQIMHLPLKKETNLSGYETIYSSIDHDIGNMICLKEDIFFIKTVKEDSKIKTKETDVARLSLKDQKTTQITKEGNIGQMIEMDGKVLVPLRGELFLITGENNLKKDTLSPETSEELSIDL
jgi:hypothetical protein